jgi:hypothetical protein
MKLKFKDITEKLLIVYKLIFIIILILLILIPKLFYLINYEKFLTKQNRVCLCTPAKKENLYIREFVEYYRKYGVDTIFLFDNNDLNGEKFENVINDYIKSGFVKVVNFRGYLKAALQMMNDCYKKNYLNYDWLIFYEVDEYIYLKGYNNIKNYLKNKKFKECQRIQLNWLMYTDNNLLYYDNRPIVERFTEKEILARDNKYKGRKSIKSILKGHISNITITDIHILNKNLKSCDGFGTPKKVTSSFTYNPDFKYYYIKHYFCKSTEEFINKINKGDVLHYKTNIMERIKVYFKMNTITIEKINLIQNLTGLNLSIFLKQIKYNN